MKKLVLIFFLSASNIYAIKIGEDIQDYTSPISGRDSLSLVKDISTHASNGVCCSDMEKQSYNTIVKQPIPPKEAFIEGVIFSGSIRFGRKEIEDGQITSSIWGDNKKLWHRYVLRDNKKQEDLISSHIESKLVSSNITFRRLDGEKDGLDVELSTTNNGMAKISFLDGKYWAAFKFKLSADKVRASFIHSSNDTNAVHWIAKENGDLCLVVGKEIMPNHTIDGISGEKCMSYQLQRGNNVE